MPPVFLPPSVPAPRSIAPLAVAIVLAALLAPRFRPATTPPAGSGGTSTPAVSGAINSGGQLPASSFTARQTLDTLRLADPSLRVALAAAEPMVEAPVVAAFDESGRLWVVEMPTYMPDVEATGEKVAHNRVVILTDTNGDGVFDKRTVFLDNLVLPRAVAPCRGGALVIEPPSLYFCPDENNDGVADRKIKLLDGFAGIENPEHAGNGLIYGLDNWWKLSQHGVEFRFDGQRVQTRPTPGHGQWGVARDDLGRLFYSPNSNALIGDVFPKHYAVRNPHAGGIAGMGQIVCPDNTTWPAVPTPGVNRGYQKGVLRADGTLASLTAACGTSCYRSVTLGPEYLNNIFVCEAAGLLVKRLILSDQDGVPVARNAYPKTEFLTSTDERFRPVSSLAGPDGALYIIDMSRGVIQHKTYVTPYLRDQIKARGLEQPLNQGRIFRVSNPAAPAAPRPNLRSAPDSELIALLAGHEGWWADTAQRLLVERGGSTAVESLRDLLKSPEPIVRIRALWSLEGLSALTATHVRIAMEDPAPTVRSNAARLAEPFLSGPDSLLPRLISLTADADRMVRVQAACSLGQSSEPAATDALAEAARRFPSDPYMRAALVSGAAGRQTVLLQRLLAAPDFAGKSPGESIAALADSAIRQSPQQALALSEVLAGAVSTGDARAGAILARFRAAQQPAGDAGGSKSIKLSAEPSALLKAGREAQTAHLPMIGGLAQVIAGLDWPGRDRSQAAQLPAPPAQLTADQKAMFDQGEQLFVMCMGCHGPDGKGLPGSGPPLAGSARAQGPEDSVIKVLLHGYEGEYTINGEKYTGAMPAQPFSEDRQFAAVLTYVRRAWGNTGAPVSPESIARVRAANTARDKAWTKAELDADK